MGEGFEAVGEMMTGGMAARAVEPHAGEGHGKGDGACLNCATPLVGEYCHACGQHGHVHRTLTAWWHDLAHGVLHLDGKIWRTLPLLAWRPGELTRRYVEGERAKFVSPMAIFLFSVFLTFAVINIIGGPIGSGDTQTQANYDNGMAEAQKETEETIAQLQGERAAAASAGQPTAELDARISAQREELGMLKMMRERGITDATLTRASDDLEDAPSWISKPLGKWRHNPELLAYKLQNNAYKFSWALIPISVPFVWSLFMFRRRYRVYDHTVFVTYSLAFMTLLVVAGSVLRWIGISAGPILLALMLIPPFHMYRQLKGAYRLSRFSALWRAVMLTIYATIAGALFFTLLVALGATG